MRCIKTGCTLRCGDYNYHGDLFIDRDGGLILKGVPENEDGSFHHLSDGSEIGEVEDLMFLRKENSYGAFTVIGLSPYAELNSFLYKWEQILWQQLYSGAV